MDIADLTQSYTAKTDEELIELAGQREHLTIEAQAALSSELIRRRIEVDTQSSTASTSSSEFASRPEKNDFSPVHIKTGPFIEEVLRFYNRHRWIFIQLIFPAVLLSFIAITFTRSEVHAVAQGLYLKYGFPLPSLVLLKMSLISASGLLTSWMVFCFSFATISSAVEQEYAAYKISISESFGTVREQWAPFLRLAVLLLGGFVALEMVVLTPISAWAIPFVQAHLGKLNSFAWFFVTYVEIWFIALILARFSLALPAVILDDRSIIDSLFRSYELTQGKWTILAALLFKGIVVSYVAGMLPFWLARWIPTSIVLPWWFTWALSGASIACVTIVEPIMFIGFAMLYLKTAHTTADRAQAVTA